MAALNYLPDTRPIPKPHLFKRDGGVWWCIASPREGDYPADRQGRGYDAVGAYKNWLYKNGLFISEWRSA